MRSMVLATLSPPRPATILDPSRGGRGSRLKNAKNALSWIPINSMSAIAAGMPFMARIPVIPDP